MSCSRMDCNGSLRPVPVAVLAAAAAFLSGMPALAQDPPQTQTDDYTRYELQAPGSGAFHIIYDVTATTPGARVFYNGIRAGAEEEVHRVIDLRTGRSLQWEVVDGAYARSHGHPQASLDGRFIKVVLARPVPADGQGRIRIDKTYVDAKSYYGDGDDIVFHRSLGIRRNAVVLPAGYELVGANYPVQVDTEDGGRIKVSFMNPGPGAVDLRVRGRPLPTGVRNMRPAGGRDPVPTEGAGTPVRARTGWSFPERAFQDRDITYFLRQPGSHAFRLFHDYTESRPGVDRYVNVVRPGSAASDAEAYDLDTGERLKVEHLKGPQIAARGIDLEGEVAGADAEVVVAWFAPVPEGGSTRLRIWETYVDPGRYVLDGDEFVWDRAFGRSRNTVVLPEGWYVTANAIPGVVSETNDGRLRIRYENPRPDEIQVFVKGRKRAAGGT